MLIEAKYKKDKILATHVDNTADLFAYNKHLRVDSSNGWTKGKQFRKVASVLQSTLDDYEKFHPGWNKRMQNSKDGADQKKAWLEFCNSPWAYGGMTVEKMVH